MNSDAPLLVLGASSAVGGFLIKRSASLPLHLLAVSRRRPTVAERHVTWIEHDLDREPVAMQANIVISLGPLRHALAQVVKVPRHPLRLIAMSSASTRFKRRSPDRGERNMIEELADTQQRLTRACQERGVVLTLLKPTLIYGGPGNANVERIAELASASRWLPYAGNGLRQPVHADDLAALILTCLARGQDAAGQWWLGGGESLSYRAMLLRIVSARGARARPLYLPAWLFKAALRVAHAMGRLRDLRAAMIDRQALDLVVDDTPARERLGWAPRPFRP